MSPLALPTAATIKSTKGIAAMSYVIEHKGKKIQLPAFNEMPVGVLRQARHESETEQTWYILENVLSGDDLTVLDSLPLSEFTKHMKSWTGGVALGE